MFTFLSDSKPSNKPIAESQLFQKSSTQDILEHMKTEDFKLVPLDQEILATLPRDEEAEDQTRVLVLIDKGNEKDLDCLILYDSQRWQRMFDIDRFSADFFERFSRTLKKDYNRKTPADYHDIVSLDLLSLVSLFRDGGEMPVNTVIDDSLFSIITIALHDPLDALFVVRRLNPEASLCFLHSVKPRRKQ